MFLETCSLFAATTPVFCIHIAPVHIQKTPPQNLAPGDNIQHPCADDSEAAGDQLATHPVRDNDGAGGVHTGHGMPLSSPHYLGLSRLHPLPACAVQALPHPRVRRQGQQGQGQGVQEGSPGLSTFEALPLAAYIARSLFRGDEFKSCGF